MRIYVIAVVCLIAAACNNGASENQEPAKSLSDSLLQEVLDGHDVAMPKMMKLQRLQQEAQTERDSLSKIKGNQTRIKLLDSTINQLKDADASMNKWMEGFRYDSLKNDEAARVSYLRAQLESVTIMKEKVLSSLSKADSVITK